jgi:fatty-acyl-CoA synthase
MVMVPVMLQRTLELGEEKIKEHDLSALRIIFLSGSALSADVAQRALEAFGPVVYNLYGSTEVSYATIATPKDLEEDPATVGYVVRGSVVKIFDDDGKQLPRGESGRIFVGNLSQFEGYTGGGGKDEIQGLLASGDVGHFDERGRLYVDGRDDEMIVSGGENVFPAEVEELLSRHEQIEEAAIIGVDDEKFGQRLKAFVVKRGDGLSEDDVKGYVKENLARYKVPREVVFVDELPRNATGKVLKRELAEKYEDEESGEGESADGEETEAKADGEEAEAKAEGEEAEAEAEGEEAQAKEEDGAEAKQADGEAEAKKDDGAEAKQEDGAEAKQEDGEAEAKKDDGAEAKEEDEGAEAKQEDGAESKSTGDREQTPAN